MAKSRVRTIRGKNPVGWKRSFDEPIELPNGRQLVTLEDTRNYITKLPKAGHEAPDWQDAMQALMLVARGGPPMLPASALYGRYSGTINASSIAIAKTSIGESGG
jgi:hypothetical protein